jgi:hypothetical protein
MSDDIQIDNTAVENNNTLPGIPLQTITNINSENANSLKNEQNINKSNQTLVNIDNKIERRGGVRSNAGRPLGSKNTATLHKEKVRRALEQRILSHADRLANAQLKLALGGMYLFRIDTITDNKGIQHRQKPVIVDDIEEIIEYLDWAYAEGTNVNDNEHYYFITTKEPDGRAIENLFDRTFGRPQQEITISSTPDNEFEQLSDDDIDEQIRLLEQNNGQHN